jgi:hypothetical protein
MIAQDRTQEPEGWTLRPTPHDPDAGWQCARDDNRLFAFGKTPEEAIANAWIEVDRPDLHAIGARLYLEQLGLRNGHGPGLVLVMAQRSMPDSDDPSWQASIVTSFGVNHCALMEIEKSAAEHGDDFGLTFPDCNQCDVLCRVLFESDEWDESYTRRITKGGPYLEIITIDGKPAVEIWDP